MPKATSTRQQRRIQWAATRKKFQRHESGRGNRRSKNRSQKRNGSRPIIEGTRHRQQFAPIGRQIVARKTGGNQRSVGSSSRQRGRHDREPSSTGRNGCRDLQAPSSHQDRRNQRSVGSPRQSRRHHHREPPSSDEDGNHRPGKSPSGHGRIAGSHYSSRGSGSSHRQRSSYIEVFTHQRGGDSRGRHRRRERQQSRSTSPNTSRSRRHTHLHIFIR
jgi:hypothetical protein